MSSISNFHFGRGIRQRNLAFILKVFSVPSQDVTQHFLTKKEKAQPKDLIQDRRTLPDWAALIFNSKTYQYLLNHSYSWDISTATDVICSELQKTLQLWKTNQSSHKQHSGIKAIIQSWFCRLEHVYLQTGLQNSQSMQGSLTPQPQIYMCVQN